MRYFADRTGDGFSAFGYAVDDDTVVLGTFEFETSSERDAFVAEQQRAISAGERSPHFIRMFQATEAAQVRGRYFLDWSKTVNTLRSEKRDDEALPLILDIIEGCERAAAIEESPAPPGWTERAAIILRRAKRYNEEVAVLERYLDQWPGHASLERRLVKARSLAGQ